MHSLVEWIAPRTVAGFVGRLLIIILMFVALEMVIIAARQEHGIDLDHLLIDHVFTITPIAIAGLLIIQYQSRLHERLSVLANIDHLTGLLNRRAFLRVARKAEMSEGAGVLILLDADHFKTINDVHGHAAGDQCLQAIGAHLQRGIRETDEVGRVGGEEFCIWLQDATAERARRVGDRLCKSVPVCLDGGETLIITLSAGGVVNAPPSPVSSLMHRADRQLYRAKNGGRGRFVMEGDEVETDKAA